MAVGDHDRLDVVRALAQVGEVGQHEIDPQHVGGREPQPGVDDDDPALVLDDRHVLADLAQAAERQDPQRRSRALTRHPAAVASMPWRSSIARTVAELVLRRARRREAAAADRDPDHAERRLEAAGQRRDRQIAVDVLQAGVDLAPAARARRPSGASRRRNVAGGEDRRPARRDRARRRACRRCRRRSSSRRSWPGWPRWPA